MSSSCPTAAPAAPCARAWPMRFYRLVRSRQADSGRPPFRRIALETSGLADPGPIALHALRRRLSRSLAAPRPRRDDDRCRRRAGDARSLSRGRRAGRQWPTCCCSPRPTWRRRPDDLSARLAALNPMARDRRCARRSTRRRCCSAARPGRPAAAAAPRDGGPCPRHLRRSVGPPAAADEPARLRHGAGRAGARSRREAAAREGTGRVRRPARRAGGDPCRAAHALSAALAGRTGPMPTAASRLVFIVRDLEPDEILRRISCGAIR